MLLLFLLVEAAQVTERSQPEWRSKFFHLARRQGHDYGQLQKLGSHAGVARTSRWWAVSHRRNDWASRSPRRGV